MHHLHLGLLLHTLLSTMHLRGVLRPRSFVGRQRPGVSSLLTRQQVWVQPEQQQEKQAPGPARVGVTAEHRRAAHRACGFVGMPNVGKSTLFNALTKTQQAQAENYPFCTIEPNEARVGVPDARLEALAKVAQSAAVVHNQIEFHDIAGLVRGASAGQGLGNKFLSHIRGVSAVANIVRCFEDDDIVHVEESVDPVRDVAIIQNELLLADLESVEKRLETLSKRRKPVPGQPDPEVTKALLQQCLEALNDGKPARAAFDGTISEEVQALQLLTTKPVLYIANTSDEDAATGNSLTQALQQYVDEEEGGEGSTVLVVSAQLEDECAALESDEARLEFLEEFGLQQTGLDRIVQASSKALGLQTFYTVGPTEARAWSIPVGATAVDAAGVIHSDFARGFIKAETIAFDDYMELGGEATAKAAGRMRQEGRDYVCKDGDIFLFRFNV